MSEPSIEDLQALWTANTPEQFRTWHERAMRAAFVAGQRAALSSPAVVRLRECAECGMCADLECTARSK